MRGSRVPAEKEAAFRGHYLRLGNASQAGKLLGLPVRTACLLGERADKDPEFAKARREMFSHALDEVESLLLDVVRTAHERHEAELPMPEVPDGFRGTVVVKDERPAYGRLVTDAHRCVLARQKHVEERDRPLIQPNVTVMLKPAESQSAVGESGATESERSTK